MKRTLWCGSQPCQERNTGTAPLRRYLSTGEYVNASGTNPAQKLVTFTDQLGSARDVLDADTRSRLGAIDYDPYGTTRDSFGTLPDNRYAGLLWDGSIGLYASATRFYDPGTTRWMTRDWIREAAGTNGYAYVNAHPTMGIDPMGYKIKFLEGTTPGYKQAYYEYKAHNVRGSPDMQSAFDTLDLSSNLYRVGDWSSASRFLNSHIIGNAYFPDPDNRIIVWNSCVDLDIGGWDAPITGIRLGT